MPSDEGRRPRIGEAVDTVFPHRFVATAGHAQESRDSGFFAWSCACQ